MKRLRTIFKQRIDLQGRVALHTPEVKIELKIADLPNPLEGTFDLSTCGNSSKLLSILTGYHKRAKGEEVAKENLDKMKIRLIPGFVADKNLTSSTSHLKPIMDTEEELGILWSWNSVGRDLSWYDYLTSEKASSIYSKDLDTLYRMAKTDLPNVASSLPTTEKLDWCRVQQSRFSFVGPRANCENQRGHAGLSWVQGLLYNIAQSVLGQLREGKEKH